MNNTDKVPNMPQIHRSWYGKSPFADPLQRGITARENFVYEKLWSQLINYYLFMFKTMFSRYFFILNRAKKVFLGENQKYWFNFSSLGLKITYYTKLTCL